MHAIQLTDSYTEGWPHGSFVGPNFRLNTIHPLIAVTNY
jgi:hypothetical protein